MKTALLVGCLLAGCAHEPKRHVYVPKSSADCWRQCEQVDAPCQAAANAPRNRTTHEQCEDKRNDCLLTCPGAHWVEDTP
jgi:hypothetical protein